MSTSTVARTIEAAFPIGYSLTSALFIAYLAKKPVHLDQYSPLNTSDEDNDHQTLEHEQHHPEQDQQQDLDHVQAQYQAQRASGMGINLARIGFSALQLGLSIFSLLLICTSDNKDDTEGDDAQDRIPLLNATLLSVSWAYFLALSFIHLIRPKIALQFWLRLQMDLFYVLTTALLAWKVYSVDYWVLPVHEWPLWFRLEGVSLLVCVSLLWVSLVTLPYRPPELVRVTNSNTEATTRLPSSEYASSLYSQLTFSWANPLIYLGYRRPLQDLDLPDIEITDYSVHSIKRYDLVK
ncbi:hypothetical protein BGZ94_007823 [Podila epigama]|nr:hypothetical protein BGZ94_007823 [Podila epigama]